MFLCWSPTKFPVVSAVAGRNILRKCVGDPCPLPMSSSYSGHCSELNQQRNAWTAIKTKIREGCCYGFACSESLSVDEERVGIITRKLHSLKLHLVVFKHQQSLTLAEVVFLRWSASQPVKVSLQEVLDPTHSSQLFSPPLLSQPPQQPFGVRSGASIQTWWAPWVKGWFFTSWGIKIQ